MRKGTESGLDSPRGVFPALLLTVECVAGTTREHQIKVELLFAQSVISIVSTLCQFLPGTAAGEFYTALLGEAILHMYVCRY